MNLVHQAGKLLSFTAFPLPLRNLSTNDPMTLTRVAFRPRHIFEEHRKVCHKFQNTNRARTLIHSSLLWQVHHILDEVVMGGMVLETNLQEILTSVKEQEELESKGSKLAQAKYQLKQQLR